MAHVGKELTLGAVGGLGLLAGQGQSDLALPQFLTGEEQPHLVFDHLRQGDEAHPVLRAQPSDSLGHNCKSADDPARRRLQRDAGEMAKASATLPVDLVLGDIHDFE